MTSQNRTKKELIKELNELQEEYNSLKESYQKGIVDSKFMIESAKESDRFYQVMNKNLPLVCIVIS